AHQSGFTPGATVSLSATLSAAGIPFTAGSHVRAEITKPGRTISTLNLNPQGDEFLGTFTTTAPGEYQIKLRATGRTDRGLPLSRERVLSAGGWRGGDIPPPGGPGATGTRLAARPTPAC